MTGDVPTIGIVQARFGSTRLPGKVLKEIADRPMLWHVVNRARSSDLLDTVLVATSDREQDDVVARACAIWDIPVYRGSESDVLDRYYKAAKRIGASVVVRLTGDCPLVDPDVIDQVVDVYLGGGWDYVSNVDPPTFPDGLDTEVFSFAALQEAWEKASLPSEREHVTPFLRHHPDRFRCQNVAYPKDLSDLRWTVDEPEDLEFVRKIYGLLPDHEAGLEEIIDVVKEHPELRRLNEGIDRNEGYRRSVRHESGENGSVNSDGDV